MKKGKIFNLVGALLIILGSALFVAPSGSVNASSHREAPLISQDPAADGTDLYAFVSPDITNTVTLIANYVPLQQPAAGPNFYKFGDDVDYEINIDTMGCGFANITYRFRFHTTYRTTNTFLYNTGQITSLDDTDLNVRQMYSVERLRRTAPALAAHHQLGLGREGQAGGPVPEGIRRRSQVPPDPCCDSLWRCACRISCRRTSGGRAWRVTRRPGAGG